MSPWVLTLGAWAVMAALMHGLWLRQRITHNAGIVDVAWSFGTGLLGVAFAALASGDPARRALIGAMAFIWGARLGGHLLARMRHESEDGRYRVLRERWGDGVQRFLLIFFQVQALWAVLFALPMLAAALNPAPGLRPLDLTAGAWWLMAMAGESLADAQLARFRADRANAGAVCRRGLWRYSRHPNYFFEWLQWFAYVALAWGGPTGWFVVACCGPVVMFVFLTRLTGVPMTEAQALRSRGEAYRAYQRSTSAFFPWFPREEGPTAPASDTLSSGDRLP